MHNMFDPLPRRRSPRSHSHDYTGPGVYLVTVCVHENRHVLAKVEKGCLARTLQGQLVEGTWLSLNQRFRRVQTDALVVMPDHVHGVLLLRAPEGEDDEEALLSLGRVMRAFKSLAAVQINRSLDKTGLPVWQRGYHDRIIRDGYDLRAARRYIENNPKRWLERVRLVR